MNGLLVKINRFLVFMKPVYFVFLLSSLFIFAASTEIFASDKNTKACVDCPEMVPIPGNKFAVGKYSVTFKEWDACVADGGCGGYQPPDNGWGRGNRPVINVSWNDAQGFIQWLSRKSGNTYRLPTEAEWEIAARAGTTTDYYWGNDVGRNHANCDGCGSEWDNRKTAPVGSFQAQRIRAIRYSG